MPLKTVVHFYDDEKTISSIEQLDEKGSVISSSFFNSKGMLIKKKDLQTEEEYNKYGELTSKTLKEGSKKRKFTYKAGKLSEEEIYQDGTFIRKLYNRKGVLFAEYKTSGRPDEVDYTLYYLNGNTMESGTFYDENGIGLPYVRDLFDKFSGTGEAWHSNKGQRRRLYKEYYKNGQLREEREYGTNYYTDLQKCSFKSYFQDGTLKSIGTLQLYDFSFSIKELLCGPYKSFHPNGQIKEICCFKEFSRDEFCRGVDIALHTGPYELYDENGNLIQKINYTQKGTIKGTQKEKFYEKLKSLQKTPITELRKAARKSMLLEFRNKYPKKQKTK